MSQALALISWVRIDIVLLAAQKKTYWENLSSMYQICIVFASMRNGILVSMHIAKEHIVPLRLDWAILHMREYYTDRLWHLVSGCSDVYGIIRSI